MPAAVAAMFSLNHQSTLTAPLIPRRDMEADGFGRDIHANVMFASWLDRMPSRHIRAGEIVRLRFLVSSPILNETGECDWNWFDSTNYTTKFLTTIPSLKVIPESTTRACIDELGHLMSIEF